MRIVDLLKGRKPKYDWQHIWKEYRKMLKYCRKFMTDEEKDIMKDMWTPDHISMQDAMWLLFISIRKSGKTTNWILVGLIMWRDYGTVIQYIRQTSDTIAPKMLRDMLSSIKKCGYISYITNGKYTDYEYHARSFTFCNRDDKGKITDQSSEFMHALSVQDSELIKSSYTAPTGDLIIFDEMISNRYSKNEFLALCDIVDTIARYRTEVWIVLLANTLNYYNMYLQELGISRDIRKLHWGDKKTLTSGSVPIYCELIEPSKNQTGTQSSLNRFRFGFNNPSIASINGGAEWNIRNYQHLPYDIVTDDKQYQCVIKLGSDMVRGEVYHDDRYGFFIWFRPCYNYKDDVIVYCNDDVSSPMQVKGIGYNRIDKRFWNMVASGRAFYATNEVGLMVEEYMKESSQAGI